MSEKVCGRCRQARPLESFRDDAGRERLSCQTCRTQARDANRVRRRQPGAEMETRRVNLWRAYRITPQEYDSLRESQGYRCAICQTPEEEIKTTGSGRPRKDGTTNAEPFRLVVDHCHNSRAVRGLLCSACNSAIGHLRDDPQTAWRAFRYLQDQPWLMHAAATESEHDPAPGE